MLHQTHENIQPLMDDFLLVLKSNPRALGLKINLTVKIPERGAPGPVASD